ncbi:MAG: rod shape-determining protein MreC [Bacteroidales bacterium]|nr:rod shape-determining protein MreC [Bacteroidales bacterium]
MRNLLRFIIRFNFQILFMLLEIIVLILLTRVNPIPRSKVFSMIEETNSFIADQYHRLSDFMGLVTKNRELILENSRLRDRLTVLQSDWADQKMMKETDTVQYRYLPAGVVNQSVNKPYNYLTLNRGAKDGIQPDMAVIGPDGIVGMVRNVSPHYCTVLSLLNPEFRTSARLTGTGFFGTIQWDHLNYREVLLLEIPAHAPVQIGDTVTTSGYSTIFPPGEMIGVVSEFHTISGGVFYQIRVKLSQDFKKIKWVYIIKNRFKAEQNELEQQLSND